MSLRAFFASVAVGLASAAAPAAAPPIGASVDFSKHLRPWDGFGVNYVEVAQTRDYKANPQEYGGFSLLTEEKRQQVIDLVFGADGLKPSLVKMFLDPFHEPENDNADPDVIDPSRFDHAATTRWMRYFAKQGLARTRARGGDLTFLTTLYGPPAWTTRQRIVRGRDLDPAMKREVAEYIIAWVRYARDVEGLPVKYISLHNEGEDYVRWPADGAGPGDNRHDYNLHWPPEQVVDFLRFMPEMLQRHNLAGVGLTPGETTNWYRFSEWGYASAIANDPLAVRNMALITSHGFISFNPNRWFGDWRSAGNDTLREKNPSLHSWVTSQSWSRMDVNFINEMRGNIYATKVNAIIPWAAIQRPAQWVGGDPNPGCAFRVDEQGNLSILPGYYLYKQVCRAGQAGMAVAQVASLDTEVGLIAFASNGTRNSDAFIVINLAKDPKPLSIRIAGSPAARFTAFRTGSGEAYEPLRDFDVKNGTLQYAAPAGSVTTFFAQ